MSAQTLSNPNPRVVVKKLIWVAPLAIGAAILVNLVLYAIASALFPESVANAAALINVGSIIGSTIAFLIIGTLVFILVARLSPKPIIHFRRLSGVALLLSFANPLMAWAGIIPLPEGAVIDGPMLVVLIMMHILTAVTFVLLLTTLTQEK